MIELNGTKEKLSRIIRDIDEITFQSDILALNAALATAGGDLAGKAFSVVADEVRHMAQRGAQAATDGAKLDVAAAAVRRINGAESREPAGEEPSNSESLLALMDQLHSLSMATARLSERPGGQSVGVLSSKICYGTDPFDDDEVGS